MAHFSPRFFMAAKSEIVVRDIFYLLVFSIGALASPRLVVGLILDPKLQLRDFDTVLL